eukprot:TRINITY_DN3245_c0_g4_i2.p1 TRINITY_DN3245_c0_g4~~TRINITY_DN3245_c0_g4_i2.p1  ORF type:complete len:168 (+),score=35.00 TRINITY_DN3245_c0_g4_i2:128-631(+)
MRNPQSKLLFSNNSMFETFFNIRNTQSEFLKSSKRDLCVIPSRSYTKPRTAQKMMLVRKKKSIDKLAQSFYVKEAKMLFNDKPKPETSKKHISYNLLRVKNIYCKRSIRSVTWNDHEVLQNLLVNSQKKVMSRKCKNLPRNSNTRGYSNPLRRKNPFNMRIIIQKRL